MRTKLKGDDDYDSLEDIEVCFSCSSVDGNNPDCERQDGTFSIDLINKFTSVVDDGCKSMRDIYKLKRSNHRVLFQNAEGNINMYIFFNDPDVDLDELFWYNTLASAIFKSLYKNEGLISVEKELNTYSCYVELHRKG